MNTMRKDSYEEAETIHQTSMPAHMISRSLASSEAHVRNVLLDPELRNIWAGSGAQMTSVPLVTVVHGEVLVKEFVQGQVINMRIHLQEHTTGCAVDVELQVGAELDIASMYDLGIDDLWEARLYAIADLLECRTIRTTNGPRIPMDQVQLTHRHH
ncbi:MAG: hypothetical protein WAR83_15150 [Flavobacteriales bacterium]|nr:hypothetical protein [Flavobacteriales bacterium]